MYDRIILHLGTPKTGTTRLQHYLNVNRDALAEKGIHYIRSFNRGPSHNYLTRLLRRRDYTDFVHRKLNRELNTARGETAVVSTETAYGIREASRILGILTAEARERTEILCYARRQDLFVEALAKQKAKNALLSGQLQDYCAAEKVRRKASYLRFAETLSARFPEIRIRFRAFDRKYLEDGDVVQDFCTFARLTRSDRPDDAFRMANRTPSLPVVEAVREHRFRDNVHRRNTLREIMKQNDEDFFRSCDVLPPQMRQDIIGAYGTENDDLFERFGTGRKTRFKPFDAGHEDNYIADAEEWQAITIKARKMVASAAATAA